jgi:hypothetical protein
MAEVVLQRTERPEVRQLAEEIANSQRAEIQTMQEMPRERALYLPKTVRPWPTKATVLRGLPPRLLSYGAGGGTLVRKPAATKTPIASRSSAPTMRPKD